MIRRIIAVLTHTGLEFRELVNGCERVCFHEICVYKHYVTCPYVYTCLYMLKR